MKTITIDKETYQLEDKDYLLIEAINNLTKQLRAGNHK